jgi:hypothetical protein
VPLTPHEIAPAGTSPTGLADGDGVADGEATLGDAEADGLASGEAGALASPGVGRALVVVCAVGEFEAWSEPSTRIIDHATKPNVTTTKAAATPMSQTAAPRRGGSSSSHSVHSGSPGPGVTD